MAVINGTSAGDLIDIEYGPPAPSNADDVIDGRGGDDQIYAYGGHDVVHGGSGRDFIDGGSGGDDLYGDEGADSIYGNGGDDFIDGGDQGDALYGDRPDGGSGNDTIVGGNGGDLISGGGGNDLLVPGSGYDEVYGGAGDDTVVVNAASDISIDEVFDGGPGSGDLLQVNTAETVNLSVMSVFRLFEKIIAGGSLIVRTENINNKDVLITAGSVTIVNGGTVDLHGKIVGTQVFNLSPDGNKLLLAGTNSSYQVHGGAAADIVEGGTRNDLLEGAGGKDSLTGFEGNDTLYGGAGDDTVNGGDGIDTAGFSGKYSEYTITPLGGGNYSVAHTGGSGIDGTDTVLGCELLQFRDGVADPAWATVGGLIMSAQGLSSLGGLISGGNGPAQRAATALTAGLSISGMAYGGAFSASQLLTAGFDFGSPGGQALKIGKGVLLTTGDGTPPLSNTSPSYTGVNNTPGDADLDAAAAAAGKASTLDAASLTFTLTVTDPAIKWITFDVVMGSEEAATASDGDIAGVFVNGVNYALFGNDPAKTLSLNQFFQPMAVNNAGSPMPIEYAGVSRVLTVSAPVHAGANTIKVAIGDTGDRIYDSGLFVSNLQGYKAGAPGMFVALAGTAGADGLTGTPLGDSIVALAGNDTVNGGEGDDIVRGGAGNDRLTGGPGSDTLVGGPGDDVYTDVEGDTILEEAGIAGGLHDLIQSAVSISLAGYANVEDVLLTGTAAANAGGNALANKLTGNEAANKLTGGAGDDSLTGGSGNDTLTGGAGQDVLAGGKGNDYLDGGSEADIFRFAASSAGNDTIAGFDVTEDRFDLSGGTFTALIENGAHTRLTHGGGQIVVRDVTGLSLDAWNALVLAPGGRMAAESGHATPLAAEPVTVAVDLGWVLGGAHIVPAELAWL